MNKPLSQAKERLYKTYVQLYIKDAGKVLHVNRKEDAKFLLLHIYLLGILRVNYCSNCLIFNNILCFIVYKCYMSCFFYIFVVLKYLLM